MVATRRKTVHVPRGLRGPQGPKGTNGESIARLVAQMNQVLGELQVQLTRIAQLQAQLDRLASGQSPEAREGVDEGTEQ
jgi:hypothetical protein